MVLTKFKVDSISCVPSVKASWTQTLMDRYLDFIYASKINMKLAVSSL